MAKKQGKRLEREVEFPQIPKKEELPEVARRLGQRDIFPSRIVARLLADNAVVSHALSGSSHSGTLSDAQHGSRGTISNAHAFADLSGSIASSQIPTAHKRRMVYYIKVGADAAAGDATAETPVFQAQDAVTITKAFFLPGASLTANDTNYATLLVYRRNTSGAGQVTVASKTTQVTGGSGNWTAFDGVDLGTISNSAVASGEMVLFEITKTGTGVVVPRGVLQVEMTVD